MGKNSEPMVLSTIAPPHRINNFNESVGLETDLATFRLFLSISLSVGHIVRERVEERNGLVPFR